MNEVVRSLRRGGEIMLAAAGPLLAAGAVWLVLCTLTGWLLVGPALYGLFAIALAAHEGRRPSPWDMFAALDDVAGPLVTGFLFWLPFALWGAFDTAAGEVPAVLTIAVVVFFAVFVHVFPVLVDQGRGPLEAFAVAARLAQAEGRPTAGRVSHLARQLLFGGVVLLALWICWQVSPLGFPVLVIAVGPLAVCVLAAWYAQRVSPAQEVEVVSAAGVSGAGVSAAAVAPPVEPPARVPSGSVPKPRRSATTRTAATKTAAPKTVQPAPKPSGRAPRGASTKGSGVGPEDADS